MFWSGAIGFFLGLVAGVALMAILFASSEETEWTPN